MPKHRYFLVYKPFRMLSQFSDPVGGKRTLGELYDFPPDVYPVGRLDEDSEGLLILSNDPSLNHALLGGKVEKEYYVQVEGIPDETALHALREGVEIRVRKKIFRTAPAQARLIPEPLLPPRDPPIRFRKSVPESWISLTLREGKNRQVRKMTAQTGYPTLRLVRWRIGRYTLEGMQPGEVRVSEVIRTKSP